MSEMTRRAVAAFLGAIWIAACDPAGAGLGFGAETTGVVEAVVYLDRDGSGTSTEADTLFAGVVVTLRPRAGGMPVAVAPTDTEGLARFVNVPVGDYLVTVDGVGLGDSLTVAGIESDLIRVVATIDEPVATAVTVRLAWPESSVRAARAAAPGSRVFLRGVMLAGVQSFSDQSAHLADTSLAIRMTNVALLGGLAGNMPGDSVVVRGVIGSANGQPILTSARLLQVATRPPPVPKPVSSGAAATAQNGTLDADLVQLTGVVIGDTVTIAPHFHVTASDGSGAVTILLDAILDVQHASFIPGRPMNVRGVLVPDGQGSWWLKPRSSGDIVFLN